MLKKISEKRKAKGEVLAWNSTIKVKDSSLRRTKLRQIGNKSHELWLACRDRVFKLHGEHCFLCGRTSKETILDCHHVAARTGQASKYKYDERFVIPLCCKSEGCKAHNHMGKDKSFFILRDKIAKRIVQLGYTGLEMDITTLEEGLEDGRK